MTQRSVSRLASMAHALRGVTVLLRQPNARIHAAVTVCVVVLGLELNLSVSEWLAVVLAIGGVIGAEALNTAVELAVDLAEPEWHALARDAKDVAAAGVLVFSVAAAIVGLLVFGPKLWAVWG